MTSVTIHRGTKQIGGCVTEIATGSTKVFIDIGHNLPGQEAALPEIDGLTAGSGDHSALFLTHYHGDHIGLLDTALPEIPVLMGKTAKAIQLNLAERIQRDKLPLYERVSTFVPLDRITVGDITVTPLMIDHSAFDAYMFVIEAGGLRFLHTGDFRLHGFRGGKTLKMLSIYARDIDYIICEGTLLSREGEPPISEHELERQAKKLMESSKYVFVLCASTNIDRIGAFYHANPRGRLFVCDKYQKKQLETVRDAHAEKTSFYDFKYVYYYAPNLDTHMEGKGFCMLVRQGNFFRKFLEKYKDNSLVIYSMWEGYIDERAENEKLRDFLAPYPYTVLHTSGHAAPDDLRRLYETVNPKRGLIPIHSEAPERFRGLLPDGNVICLEDGEVMTL
jgi:ribonuclease J